MMWFDFIRRRFHFIRGQFHYSNCIKYNQNNVTQNYISSETYNWYMYTIWEIETPNLWFTQMLSQGEVGGQWFLLVLAFICFLWNSLCPVSNYIMGPFSGWLRQGGNGQHYLAAPIWKYSSGIGDHRFKFFMDLLPNYTFYTNLSILFIWVSAYRRCDKPDDVQFMKSSQNYATLFDASLTHRGWDKMAAIFQMAFWSTFSWMKMFNFSIYISWKFVSKDQFNNTPALV